MKKKIIILLVMFLNINYFCYVHAQQGPLKKVETLHAEYLTKELSLTPAENEKFWKVYNDYRNELRSTRKENGGDAIELEEKLLNTRKKYKNDFKKVLGSDERVNKLFVAEKSFREILRNELQNRRANKPK